MPASPFLPADILLPRTGDMTRWACIACDQYTSEPAYWEAADRLVGDAPSALRLVLPELYLSAPDAAAREEAALAAMDAYLRDGLFREYPDCFFYVERTLRGGAVRRGLVGALDLECYDYRPGAKPPVRATEACVQARIPPRLRIRSRAALELPHVLLLADDAEDAVLSAARRDLRECVYDFPLTGGAGAVRAHRVGPEGAKAVLACIAALGDAAAFAKKYGAGEPVLHIAVGDGNHSLATAKAHYDALKERLGEAALRHPARYALCELENLHDPALVFEPIHRVAFEVDPACLLSAMAETCGARPGRSDGHNFTAVTRDGEAEYTVPRPEEPLCVGTLQKFLDRFCADEGGRIDYIHGEDAVRALTRRADAVGFLLPGMRKEDLFPAVVRGGVLPRKTFSMGEAQDKRFYVEARRIR